MGLAVESVGNMLAYQKALPYSFRSSSFEWFFTVVKALPVAFLWYVFLDGSPPWFVSVILYRTGTVVDRNRNCFCNRRKAEREVVWETV
jgi:hypothetical protein